MFRVLCAYAPERKIWSKQRRVAKGPNVCVKGRKPSTERPAAMPTMSASAMPHWTKRSGWLF